MRRAAEARLSSRAVNRRPQTEAEWRRLSYELEVHQIELEMQSEELRLAKAEIEDQLALFTDLYDFAPVGYFNLSGDSTIHLVNLAGAKLLGLERSKLMGRRLQLFIPETDRPAFNTFLERIFATRAQQAIEIRLVQNNQKPLNIRLEAAMSPDGKSCRLMVQDISHRKRAEESQQRSEERYRTVVNAMAEGVVVQSPDGTIIDCNEQAARILGLTRDRLLGKTSRDPRWRAVREDGSPFPGEEHPAMIALKTGQPCREVVMGLQSHKGGEWYWININAEPLFQNGSTRPHGVVVTFSDITKRKQVEAALQESNALLSLFLQHSPIFAYIKEVTPDASRVLFASDNFNEMIGLPGSAMQGKTMTELFPAEFAAKITRDDQAVLAKGEVLKVDEELNGRHYATVKFPIIQGGRSLLAGYTIDITDRKQAEAALRQSEERFRAIADFSPDIISIFDREGRLVFTSAAAFKIHGYRAEELENRSTFDFIHPDDRPGVTAAFSRLLNDQAEEVKVQYRYRNANGSYKWMEAIGRNEIKNPQINGIIAISRDITERKQTEAALRDNELKFRQLADNITDVFWITSPDFKIMHYVSSGYEKIWGRSMASLYSRPHEWFDSILTEDKKRVADELAKLAGDTLTVQVEYRIARPNGEIRWIMDRAFTVRDAADKPVRRTGIAKDITESKQAEMELRQLNETLDQRVDERTAALQESEERFRAIATNTPDHILIQDRKLRYQMVINPQLGLSEAEMIGKIDRDLFKPADAARLTALKKRVLKTGKPVRLETPFPNLKGELEYFEGIYTPKRNATGKVDGLIGYFRNVTERKRSEETLKESEAKFSVAFKNSPTPMNISRVDNGLIVDANDAFIAITGYPRKEVINSNIKSLGIWANPKIRAQIVKQLIDQGKVTDKEFQYRKKNGEVGTGIYSAHRIHLKNVPHILSAVKDITERKRAEGALLESERLHRLLFTNLLDALVTVEAPTWKIVVANPAAVKMFRARNVEQLLAAKPWELSPEFQPDGRPSLQAARVVINKAMQQGTHSFEWRHRRLNGEEFPASVLLSRVEVAGRTLVQGTVRDLTERVRLEQEVLNISDWERRHIAQDLHDGLGQLLVGAGYLADSLRQDMTAKSEPWVPRLNRIQAAINAAGKQARDVARGVQPVEPEPNGLMTALAKLAQQTSELFHVRCDFKCHPPVNIEDRQTGTHLFRIAQESVTNAIKHGKAKRISLHLTQTPKQITLAIKDDGVGLTSSRQKKDGMGLRIMHYRAGIIGGTLTINNKSVIGTTVTCRVPVSDGKHRPAKGGKD